MRYASTDDWLLFCVPNLLPPAEALDCILTHSFPPKALDIIGVGRAQVKLVVICGCWWAADAMEVMLLSFLLPQLESAWHLRGYVLFFISNGFKPNVVDIPYGKF